jgi:hypothetical protein
MLQGVRTKNIYRALLGVALAGTLAAGAYSKLVAPGPDGKLKYTADEKGNTIPDFSNCGYRGGGVPISDVAVKTTLAPEPGASDDSKRIQSAIDELAKEQPDANGIRGAILLKRGKYRIASSLKIHSSGIVLRGEGEGEDGTILFAAGKTQRNVIEVKGAAPKEEPRGQKITDEYVPVGAHMFSVASSAGFKVGDKVIVSREGNAAWIHFIKMDQIQQRPKTGGTRQWTPFALKFDRTITKIDDNKITVDAPIVCAIEQQWGGGTIAKYDDAGRIENIGVENLRGVSEFDPKIVKNSNDGRSGAETPYPADEEHALYVVAMSDAKNCWVKHVTGQYFYNGVAELTGGAKWVTVQDSTSIDPVSEITGGRRYPFAIQGAQQVLFLRCHSRDGRHAFVVGSHVAGPNVFLECESTKDHATSEPHHRWSTGGLYDNVHGHFAIQDRQYMGSGHGWAGANYVMWNCEGTLVLQQPPTAQNYAIGFVGEKAKGAFPRPDGYWESFGKHVEPKSLYWKQLEDRLGKEAVKEASGD